MSFPSMPDVMADVGSMISAFVIGAIIIVGIVWVIRVAKAISGESDGEGKHDD